MNNTSNVEVAKLDSAIRMLKEYTKEPSIEPLIAILEALKQDPHSESLVAQLSDAFKGVGPLQGAVLTYAPYVSILLSEDPFGDN